MKKGRCNIIIIEPSNIVISGLNSLIGSSSQFVIIGSYSDIEGFQSKYSNDHIDMVIINPMLVSYIKRGVIKSLFPEACIVAMQYSHIDKETLIQFHEVIDIYDKPEKILYKLENIIEQERHDSPISDAGDLSDREKEILIAVAKGMINKEIANVYHLSVHTVISHRKNISRKIGIKSVSGFVLYALLNNLIEDYEIQ